MACLCCQLWFCCDKMMAAPCHGEWRCACEHRTHQVAAAGKAPLWSAWKAVPWSGMPRVRQVQMLHSHRGAYTAIAHCSWCWLSHTTHSSVPGIRLPDPIPATRPNYWGEHSLPRCHLEHSEQNPQSLELISEHSTDQLCDCLCRALQSKQEQKQREKTDSFSL